MRLTRMPAAPFREGPLLASLFAGVLLLVARFFPFERFNVMVCPLRRVAHIPCPGCGMTRAFVRFTHGDWMSAVRVSPLGALLAVAAALAVLYGVLRLTVLRRGFRLDLTPRESLRWQVVFIGALLLNWAYLLASGAATS